MESGKIIINGMEVRTYSYNTVVVGSGAAALSCANNLYKLRQRDVCVVTEGMLMGTSRNTGSDKQTYYKLTTSGQEEDSVYKMASTLFSGGAMDGDIALCEAAMSTKAFYNLVDIGVPFPHNAFFEYVGYKTDHDPCKRGTSAGPLTSKFMTECLQREVEDKNIKIFDFFQVIEILTHNEKAVGILCLDLKNKEDANLRYTLFSATNIVYATGGEAGIYKTSVYPHSQTGGTGVALRAGAIAKNLTEWQYGIASKKFRWNLSGTYQQVIPTYFSTDQNGGDEREFLNDYFESTQKMLTAIFLKGYQWPFDPRKISNCGSSLIDILVYNETAIKGRRVFLDYRRNPTGFSFDNLESECYDYLKNSNALLDTPIDRLNHMNSPAIALYSRNNIDLFTQPLEIGVCAQHNNGGLSGNMWWESNIKNLFPIGEVNGTHGVYRPGGSALNSGQVGALRAGAYIAQNNTSPPLSTTEVATLCKNVISCAIGFGEGAISSQNSPLNMKKQRDIFGERMSKYGAHIRSKPLIEKAITEAEEQLSNLCDACVPTGDLGALYKNRDLLVSQITYLNAMLNYIEFGGKSRGSFLVYDELGTKDHDDLEDLFTHSLEDGALSNKIQEVRYSNGDVHINWRDVRPLPEDNNWFENVWRDYLDKKIIK